MTTKGDDSAPGTSGRFRWLRAASDRVPTRWFAAIGTGLFLVATAAFGGLSPAASPAIARLEPGEQHHNDQLALTVERAVLVDEYPDAGVYVEEGQRVAAIVLTVENTWTEPLPAYADSSVTESFTVEELAGTPADSVARADDATVSPWLQPGVPVRIVVAWAVDAGRFADGDALHLTLNDMTLHTGSFVANGQWWTDPVAAATVTVPLDDEGPGT